MGPRTFRRGLIANIRQKSGKSGQNLSNFGKIQLSKIWQKKSAAFKQKIELGERWFLGFDSTTVQRSSFLPKDAEKKRRKAR